MQKVKNKVALDEPVVGEPVADAGKDEPSSGKSEGVRVTNDSTTTLPIMDLKMKPGTDAYFNNFDPDTKIHAAWIKAGMISVKPA